MSATSEILAEQLRKLEHQITELELSGGDSTHLKAARAKLSEQFRSATTALNEGKTVLKG